MTVLEAIGVFFVLFGVFFSIVGVVGLVRFPDVYSRIHTSGKVSTLGVLGLIIAVIALVPESWPRAIALIAFLIGTAPVASHAMANGAYRSGVPMVNAIRDDLEGEHIVVPRKDIDAYLESTDSA